MSTDTDKCAYWNWHRKGGTDENDENWYLTNKNQFTVCISEEGRRSPTRPRCSINSKTPKHPMQKHKRRVQHETEKRHTTCKHQTQKTTHKPTRPMGNRCRLWTAICHASSKWCGYPGLRAHNPPTFPITQRSRRTYNCGVKQPPHCQMTTHKQDRKTQGPKQHRWICKWI